MARLKTRPTGAGVTSFLARIADPGLRSDCRKLSRLMRQATGSPPKMWGPSIVGFGRYRYHYPSGRQGEWFLTGYSPRKKNLTVYIMSGFEGEKELLGKLGRFTAGKSCLYLRSLDEVHLPTLKRLIGRSVRHLKHSGRSPE